MRQQNEQHLFSHVPSADIPRSTFNRSHGYKTTFDAGYLIPFYVDEALPGDTFSLSVTAFARLATPIYPIMDNLWMDFFFFAVPNRLLWDNWQRFMGERDPDPDSSTDYLLPQIQMAGAVTAGSLSDYMGLPAFTNWTGTTNRDWPSALPFRAYNLIWNEWFRDENLQDSVVRNRDDGPDLQTDYALLRRGKRHDYFTSCLPWPQKGEAVMLPLGETAPIISAGAGALGQPTFTTGGSTSPLGVVTDTSVHLPGPAGNAAWVNPALLADLSTATAATINSLRQAFQLQKWFERDARGGTRYTEILRSHFGVVSPDARLQRPEFLGGGSCPVNINPVAQTSGTPPDLATGYSRNPQGNLAAFGTTSARGIGFSKSFVEHMTLIGLVMVRADLSYQQGLHKMWSRRYRYDFYWPAFSHLGEQAVLNKEIYMQGGANSDTDNAVFGYQERWAEYRYFPSLITGQFRSDAATPLDSWHLAQDFTALPTLNASFIEENPPVDRVIAVPSEPHFLFDSIINIRAARPMPTYSVPGLIDHF